MTARKPARKASAMETLRAVTDAEHVCREFQRGVSFKALNARRSRALRALLKSEQAESNELAAQQFALWMWGLEYSRQSKSANDWYAALPDHRKRLARQAVGQIIRAAVVGRGRGKP